MSGSGLRARYSEEEGIDSLAAAQLEKGVGEELLVAVRRGEARRVEELLSAHLTLLQRPDPKGGQPLLMVALAEGHGEVVEVLMKRGADHSITDKDGNSPLHVVAGRGNYDALRVFLTHVELPDMNCTNKRGDSVLMEPAGRGFSIVVECLLQHNADPNKPNKEGRTPIMEAARKGHKEVIKVLLRFGADVLLTSYKDYSGMPTALREAVACGSPEITAFITHHCNRAADRIKELFTCKTTEEVDDIIKNGCSINHRRGDGVTALMVHAESGNVGVVCRLLDSQAFIDSQDMNGLTALMKSSFRGRLDVVEELVRRGALIDLKCREGRTAVMYAVMGDSLEVTNYLAVSGADLTIVDNYGRRAMDLTTNDDLQAVLLQRSSARKMKADPFAEKLSEYLQIKRMSPKLAQGSGSPDSPSQQRKQLRSDQSKTEKRERERGGEESREDPMKRELNRYFKRVAELETRIEELTIRAEFSGVDEDLSHYRDQPDRLIGEFKKLKMAKKKAEQFAIEAKQSAQKASVELGHVKEELLTEQHSNELKMKHMMSDMEEMATKQTFQEIAYKSIIKAFPNEKTPQEIRVDEMPRHKFSPEAVFDTIVNGDIKTRFKVTLMGVSGLPGSGKSTLVDKLVPIDQRGGHTIHGLRMYEVGYCSTSHRDKFTPEWGEFTREETPLFMLARALATKEAALPELEQWTDENNLPMRCLQNRHLRDHFELVYNGMREGVLKFAENRSDYRFHLLSEPSYVLLNVFDIGVSKALYETLPLIARLMHPFVLLNVLDLSRDGQTNLRYKPDTPESEQIMEGRSRGHYYVRISRLCKAPGHAIMILTHRDKLPKGEVETIQHLTEAGIRAKAGDVGASESMESEMLAVNLHSKDDIECIKRVVEEIVGSTKEFDHDLHLTWIFLRSALVTYTNIESDFRMSREVFDTLARECGLKSKEEIEQCLEFFTKIGSLMYSPEFFKDQIITHPQIFLERLNTLFDSVDKGDYHCRASLGLGILCKSVAEKMWGKDKDFYWDLMQEASVAVPIKPDPEHYYDEIKCPHEDCAERELLFFPPLRTGRFSQKEAMKKDSLYITFNCEYMPGNLQAQFVKRLKPIMRLEPHIPEFHLKLSKHYNSTEFGFATGGSFLIVVHGDATELVVTGFEDNPKLDAEIKTTIKAAAVLILDSVLKYFPGFLYQLGFLCKGCCTLSDTDPAPKKSVTSYIHFLPTQCETQLYCREHYKNKKRGDELKKEESSEQKEEGDEEEEEEEKSGAKKEGGKMIKLSESQMRWMKVFDKECEVDTECYEAKKVPQPELEKVVRLIPLHCYSAICTKLSPERTTSPSEEKVVAVLTVWQRQSPNNRRERMARILLRMGCYKAAIKLDPKVYNASVEEVPPDSSHYTLSTAEVEILCNCAIQWRQLAAELGMTGDTVREIEQLVCTSDRERCRKVLQVFSTEEDARGRVIDALTRMGWETAAKSLRCGYTNRYSPHHLV